MLTGRITHESDEESISTAVQLFVAYRHFYGCTGDEADAERFLRTRLRAGDSLLWGARDDGRVVGLAQVYPGHTSLGLRTVWTLNDLFVTPEARGIGAGRALVEQVVREASGAGAAVLRLETQPTNCTARALYESLGFVVTTAGSEFLTYELSLDPTEGKP